MKEDKLEDILSLALSSNEEPSINLNKDLKEKLKETKKVKVWWIPILGNIISVLSMLLFMNLFKDRFLSSFSIVSVIFTALLNIALLIYIFFNRDLRERMVIEI
ncbi:MAG: hypothetical protein ACRDCB_13435 [Clostridium sp.]